MNFLFVKERLEYEKLINKIREEYVQEISNLQESLAKMQAVYIFLNKNLLYNRKIFEKIIQVRKKGE